ncbi:MAG TPA: outer membrane beta-barrel protein [Gemmatimonadaceae bacterium]|nr:outer membrane beta-barrel protein [Gemmatimonadaceae bacterium]
MNTSSPALAVIVALIMIAPVSHGQISSPLGFGVVGGTTSPSGPLRDVATSGWHAGAFLELKLPVIPIGFRLEGTYHQLGSKHILGTDDSPRVLAGTVDATYTLLPLPIIKPYLIAGVGQYNVRSFRDPVPIDCAAEPCEVTRSAFGVNAGAGVRVELAGFAAFVEARWHDAYTSGKHAQMVPISVGLRF